MVSIFEVWDEAKQVQKNISELNNLVAKPDAEYNNFISKSK